MPSSRPKLSSWQSDTGGRYTRHMSSSSHASDKDTAGRYRQLSPFIFHRELAATAGTSLLFLVSQHCGACNRWKQLLRAYAANESITVFEVDAGDDAALAREFNIFHLPSLFLFNDGQYHHHLECEAHEMHLRAAITHALSQQPEEPP